jgi:enamine deaminase RidA (YjgF/YER057c/UK114 family)
MLKALNPANIAPPAGKYQHAVEVPAAARTLFISGQIGLRPDGKLAHGIEAQADAVWANLKAILAEAGMTYADLVKVTIYLVDAADIVPSRAARDRALGPVRPPASTLAVIKALASPDYLIEIEAIAAKA